MAVAGDEADEDDSEGANEEAGEREVECMHPAAEARLSEGPEGSEAEDGLLGGLGGHITKVICLVGELVRSVVDVRVRVICLVSELLICVVDVRGRRVADMS